MKDQNDLNINDIFKISSKEKPTNEKKLEEITLIGKINHIIKSGTKIKDLCYKRIVGGSNFCSFSNQFFI